MSPLTPKQHEFLDKMTDRFQEFRSALSLAIRQDNDPLSINILEVSEMQEALETSRQRLFSAVTAFVIVESTGGSEPVPRVDVIGFPSRGNLRVGIPLA